MSTTTPSAPPAAKKTASKKAAAKKAPAKKTTTAAKPPAKKAATARPAKKAAPAQLTVAEPTANKKKDPAKKPRAKAKKKPTARSIGGKAIAAARFARQHPFLALIGTTVVASTLLYRGVLRPTGRAAAVSGRATRAAGSWAWSTGRAYVARRRGTARPLTGGTHANCRRCKGTGTLPRHDAHGRFLGSISCTG
ncbi:hypothetical protein AB0O31_32970 [Kitasatospora cineracea]|uniref:hypothetical protein n=1 Tax=Kitasatospora cineracea TaxID=88074 RepID=UPI0034490999